MIDCGESATVLYTAIDENWNEERIEKIKTKFEKLCTHLEKYLDDNKRDFLGGMKP
jgi:hypothetical protein